MAFADHNTILRMETRLLGSSHSSYQDFVTTQLRVHWAEQIERWIPDIYGEDIKVVMNGKSKPDALVNIISYDLVPRMTVRSQELFSN